MFEKLYKTVDSQVQASEELINKTKIKMKEEIKNSNKVVHINFYKYGTLSAFLVIFIGVLAANNIKEISLNEPPIISESANDSYKEPLDTNISVNSNPFNGSMFDSAMSANSHENSIGTRNSFLDNIVGFFINIIQWFKELLF